MTVDLLAAGVAECELDESTIDTLPANNAPAPWVGGGHGIIWGKKIDGAMRERLHDVVPEVIRTGAQPIGVGGFLLFWDDTPVGPYREIGAIVVFRSGWSVFGHVPFIAVDSPASLVGGRDNWAIPKTLATFTGDPGRDETAEVDGPGFAIRTRQHASRLIVPTFAPKVATLVQARPDGTALATRPTVRALVRPARVDVTIEAGPALTDWVPSGRCRGVVAPAIRMGTGIAVRRVPTR